MGCSIILAEAVTQPLVAISLLTNESEMPEITTEITLKEAKAVL
jgi:hypothetical protein